jgi:hypothetical protein
VLPIWRSALSDRGDGSRLSVARSRWAALVLSVGVTFGAPAAGEARSVSKLAEHRLRAIEERTLGTEHAADHAAQRRLKRTRRSRAGRSRLVARAAATGPADRVGAWDGVAKPLIRSGKPEGIFAINAALLPTGKVLWFSYPRESENTAYAVLWDPATGTFKDVVPPINPATGRPYNIFCGGISMLADGRVLVTGGVLGNIDGYWQGLDETFTFDPFTERWQRHERMRHGRYYPSQLLLPDGRTFIIQGSDEVGRGADNLDLELFDPAKALGAEVDLIGTLPTWARGDFYPHVFWMPSGRGMVAGPYPADSWFLESGGTGGEALGFGFRAVDAANQRLVRTWGSGVLLPLSHDQTRGEIVQYGGADDTGAKPHRAVASAEGYSEATGSWSGEPTNPSMNVARAHLNTVLLPDGSMVSIGGGVGDDSPIDNRTTTDAHKQVELWDPVSRRWTLGPSQREGRAYHSTAMLLPDGSVVSAGDDYNGGYDRDSYEIYRPPYFFNGSRPTISAAPSAAGYSQTVSVGSPNVDIDRAVLVAPSSTTHAVDVNQRVVNLPAVRRGDGSGYDVRTPANVNVAPPGYYMLFLVDTHGRPSVARWVQLHPSAGPTPAPGGAPAVVEQPAPGGTAPTPGGTPTVPPRVATPVVRAALRQSRLKQVRRARRIIVRVQSDSPARVALRATVTRRLRGAASRPTTVADWRRRVRFSEADARTLAMRLTAGQARRLKGDVRAKVSWDVRRSDGSFVQRKVLRVRLR